MIMTINIKEPLIQICKQFAFVLAIIGVDSDFNSFNLFFKKSHDCMPYIDKYDNDKNNDNAIMLPVQNYNISPYFGLHIRIYV